MSSGNAITRRKLLSSWYFEDQLKETYTTFVLALNTVAHDTVESNKEKAISAMYKLLAGNAEQEKVSVFFYCYIVKHKHKITIIIEYIIMLPSDNFVGSLSSSRQKFSVQVAHFTLENCSSIFEQKS